MGVAELIARIPDIYAFRVDIVGQNPTEQSAFKLLVSGTDSLGASTELFETAPIPSVSTADEIRTILLTAALGMSLPIKRTDIEVRLGNPVSVINPVLLTPASLQPELDVSDPDNIESYVGSWYIRFTGALTTNYSSITAEVVQDTSAFMRGVSAVVTQPTTDMPSGETTIFHDVINRPYNFPWRIGTTCIATYFIGIGMGIIGSDFRNLESVVLSAPDEGGEEE